MKYVLLALIILGCGLPSRERSMAGLPSVYTREGWGVFDSNWVQWYGPSLNVALDACEKYGKGECTWWAGG